MFYQDAVLPNGARVPAEAQEAFHAFAPFAHYKGCARADGEGDDPFFDQQLMGLGEVLLRTLPVDEHVKAWSAIERYVEVASDHVRGETPFCRRYTGNLSPHHDPLWEESGLRGDLLEVLLK